MSTEKIMILCYAADTVLIAERNHGLQKLLLSFYTIVSSIPYPNIVNEDNIDFDKQRINKL